MGNKILWDADDYEKSNGGQIRDAKETIDLIIKDVPNTSDMIVVDIGCGSGNVTKKLTESLSPKKVYASDFDSQMVDYANKNHKDETIEYFVQDISVPWDLLDERLKNLEGKVDLVWSNRVLHWVPDKLTAAKTIARLLKPGGRCYINITLFRDPTEFATEEEAKEMTKYFDFESHESQTKNWDSHFKNSGLSNVNIDFLEKEWVYESEEQIQEMFSCIEPFLHKFSRKEFKELSEEEKASRLKTTAEKFTKFSHTPYGKNPKTDITKNKLLSYYQQFKVVGIK